MTGRLLSLLLLAFLLSFTGFAQSDSIGTLHVKKKGNKDTLALVSGTTSNIFIITEEMPLFPSTPGMTMEDFIRTNYIVPQEAFDKGISGSVIVQFVVEANGQLTNIKVKKGVPNCAACDAEAIRVVKMMPPWIPGTQNGRPVPVLISIPVKFRFNN